MRLLRLAAAAFRLPHFVLWVMEPPLLRPASGGPSGVLEIATLMEELKYCTWAQRQIDGAGFGIPTSASHVVLLASLHGDARDVLLGMVMKRRTCA